MAIAFFVLLGVMSYFEFGSFAEIAPHAPLTQGPPITEDQREFFEAKIRPVMVKSCYQCHSATSKDIEGDLLLDSRSALLKGGKDGPVIVPGNPDKSMLIEAIRYGNKDLQMPPDDGGGKLSDSVIHDFEAWVKMGAPDPRDGAAAPVVKTYDTTEAKKWWAFQPLKRPDVPHVNDITWARGDIDRYVQAGLEAKGIKPVGDADKQTLIRRVYFDLIGLPPTPAEIDAFENDDSPNAFMKVVDDLLSRPQFGEHWGRHWLDVARYAESSGKEFNVTFPNAWRYRDYVISSFNQDKPYNQFVREQIAGDLLPSADPKHHAEQLIATGFLAVGPKELDEQVSRQFDLDLADEQVDATSQAFLGLTVSCARCHDHKFDPISQKDYYGMAGIFLSTKTDYGTLAGLKNRRESDLVELPAAAKEPVVQTHQTPAQLEQLKKDLEDAQAKYDALLADRPYQKGAQGQTAQQGDVKKAINFVVEIRLALERKAKLESELNTYDEFGNPKAFCMGVQDRPPSFGPPRPMRATEAGLKGPLRRQASGFETINDSPLFFRGEANDPRDRVPRGTPAFLTWSRTFTIPQDQSGRLELADWLVSARNPLTARVMANRIWSWLFGQGIVASVDNFGTMGDAPANQALLDGLASQLIDNGWSIKRTIRQIVLSRAYQLAGTYDEDDFTADPQNTLIWRHSKRRLNAECIRDAMLASSGELNLTAPLASPVALAGDGPIAPGNGPLRVSEDKLVGAENNYRSVYLPVARDEIPDAMAVFDLPDASSVSGTRETTNVPGQALYMLNNNFVHAQAAHLAQRLEEAFPSDSNAARKARVNLAFTLVFDRPANNFEQNAAAKFFGQMSNDASASTNGTWTDFCLALYNTAEFRYTN